MRIDVGKEETPLCAVRTWLIRPGNVLHSFGREQSVQRYWSGGPARRSPSGVTRSVTSSDKGCSGGGADDERDGLGGSTVGSSGTVGGGGAEGGANVEGQGAVADCP